MACWVFREPRAVCSMHSRGDRSTSFSSPKPRASTRSVSRWLPKTSRKPDNESRKSSPSSAAPALIDELVVERELSIVAAVGEEMCERPGIAGRLFNVLGSSRINVRAIAQGSSELNISLVIARADEKTALNAIHNALLGESLRTAHVVVAGIGGVGSELLSQIASQADALRASYRLELRLAGVATSRAMKCDRLGLDPTRGRKLVADGPPVDVEALASFIESLPSPRVFVDVTASADVPENLPTSSSAGGRCRHRQQDSSGGTLRRIPGVGAKRTALLRNHPPARVFPSCAR